MAVGGATCSQARHRRTSVLHKLYSGMVRDIERTHPSEHQPQSSVRLPYTYCVTPPPLCRTEIILPEVRQREGRGTS